jgi:hypothetical protein
MQLKNYIIILFKGGEYLCQKTEADVVADYSVETVIAFGL